jgi:hypothetical protein
MFALDGEAADQRPADNRASGTVDHDPVRYKHLGRM